MTPTVAEMQDAVRAGAPVRFGLPAHVKCADGWTACLDLVRAHRGEPDPWLMTRSFRGVVDMVSAAERGLYVAGMPVSADDLDHVDQALASAPTEAERHTPAGEAARIVAGRSAMRITDNMIRARVMDAVDGWAALLESGEEIDRSADGVLLTPPSSMSLACRLLVVSCPSTGRKYVLRVPVSMQTAREARLWTFGDGWKKSPEIET